LHIKKYVAIVCALLSWSAVENKADLARGETVPEAVSEVLRMIDTFASVGASKIHVTKTDINCVVQWGRAYSPEDLRKVLPAMIRVAGKLEQCDILDKKTGNVAGQARAGGNLMARPMIETKRSYSSTT
jgi:hypothetical protein